MSAPKLRVVTDPDREIDVRDQLLREAVRFATTVSDTKRAEKAWIHVARAERLLAAAVAYLDVVGPSATLNGDTSHA